MPKYSRVPVQFCMHTFIIHNAFGQVVKMKEDCASRIQLARADEKGESFMTERILVVIILVDC